MIWNTHNSRYQQRQQQEPTTMTEPILQHGVRYSSYQITHSMAHTHILFLIHINNKPLHNSRHTTHRNWTTYKQRDGLTSAGQKVPSWREIVLRCSGVLQVCVAQEDPHFPAPASPTSSLCRQTCCDSQHYWRSHPVLVGPGIQHTAKPPTHFTIHSSSSSWREDSWGPLRRLSMMTVILCLLPLPSDTQWW